MACQISAFLNNFNQVYKNIKIECLRANRLFKDDKFPSSEKSLGLLFRNKMPIRWIRAKELFPDAQLFADDPFDHDLYNPTLGEYGLKKGISISS